ncbi:Fur family transcriptional regulator [Leifsonia sp. L25]|uniref:Fur family transcriptional regulator n=1 Tax=Actinomycetes TaxID=1760 RepID=UPI003D6938DE
MGPTADGAAPSRQRAHRYRSLVLSALAALESPISAQSLYTALRGSGERIGLATVYRELHALTRNRQIEEAFVGGETVYRVSQRDLLVCDGCGRTEEVGAGVTVEAALDRFFGGAHPVTVHGVCTLCSSK